MSSRSPVRAPIVLAVLVGAGCASPTSPDVVVEPIQVDRVDVRILESSPPQAWAHVEGTLGDGCASFHSLHQERAGATVVVTILRQRPREAICTMIAKPYETDIRLEGLYPPGTYVLRVNGLEKTFRTE